MAAWLVASSFTVHLMGDSTMAEKNLEGGNPERGWGMMFQNFLDQDVKVVNYAQNGRSTKSFIDESRLAPIYDEITKGDFLFIQFGHNDEKKNDPARYTDPHGEFIVNLGKFVNVARNKGADPVFITSVERRLFDENGKLKPSEHTEYVLGMKEAARDLDVPVIDLFTMSRDFLTKTGDEDSKKYYMNLAPGEASWAPEVKTDNSHLKYEGAMLYAGMIAKGLRDLGGVYASLLADEALEKDTENIETNG